MTAPLAEGAAAGRPLPGPRRAAWIAFLAGAGVLALEITGARLFMPWFGSTMLVWSNVIGVTLAAVAAGNFAGGRLADRRPDARVLSTLLALAALGTALAPFAAQAVARFALPAGLPLEVSYALTSLGSLLAALVALGPPLFLLGAASPLLLRGAIARGAVGRSTGLVYGAGTAGSLLGTWLPVHLGVPFLGSRRTLLCAAALLLVAAALALQGSRRRGALGATLALVLLAPFCPDSLALRLPAGTNVLAELETPYQYARVEEADGVVTLRLNEGLDSYHSLTVRGEVSTRGAYFDAYPAYVPPAADGGEARVLVLGHAAGTIARQMLALYPPPEGPPLDVRVCGVELDPAVAALGPAYFELPAGDPRLEVVSGVDGRIALERDARTFDLIVVDTYAHQVYVPFQTCSREFFAAGKRRLRDGGVLVANLSGFSAGDRAVVAIRNTAAAVFGRVALQRIEGGRNFVLVARSGGEPPRVTPDLPGLPDALRGVAASLASPGAFRTYAFDPNGTVLTDDLAPIEHLADEDLRARARALLAAAAGTDGA